MYLFLLQKKLLHLKSILKRDLHKYNLKLHLFFLISKDLPSYIVCDLVVVKPDYWHFQVVFFTLFRTLGFKKNLKLVNNFYNW